MSYQIFFKDGGAGLSSIKSTCAEDGIVADAAGYWSVAASAGDGDGSVAATVAGDGSFSASSAGDVSFAAASGDGSVASAAGYGSEVGRTGVSGVLGTGVDGSLRL